jgi:hypothetical protein
MVALPDRTAFQGMRQQTVANARNLDSVAIAPPVSTAPPPRPEVDPAVRAPTPTDLWRTASYSLNNRLNSDQNYLNLIQQNNQLSQFLMVKQKQFLLSRGISDPAELQPRNMAEFQNNPRQPIIDELTQFLNSQPEMQQLQNTTRQVTTYMNNTYGPDMQRLKELRDQEVLYQRQLYEQQTKLPYQQQQQQLQTPQFKPAPPPPRPEVDPEEKIPESFTPAVPTSTNTNMVVDPIRQPFVPKPVKPEVDPEEKILKVPDRKSTTDYEDFVRMTGGGGRPLVSFKPADTTGAKHSGQGVGGQGGLPSVTPIQGSGPQLIVDPLRPSKPADTTGAKHSGQGLGGRGGIPALPNRGPQMIVDPLRPAKEPTKRKAGMAPGQYSGINTNVRGLMG